MSSAGLAAFDLATCVGTGAGDKELMEADKTPVLAPLPH